MSIPITLNDKERWSMKMRAKLLNMTIKDYIRWIIIKDLEDSGFLKLADIRFTELSEGKISKEDEEYIKNLLFKEMLRSFSQ